MNSVCTRIGCRYLHICKYETAKVECNGSLCKRDHTVDTVHNQKILKDANLSGVDLRILKKAIKV